MNRSSNGTWERHFEKMDRRGLSAGNSIVALGIVLPIAAYYLFFAYRIGEASFYRYDFMLASLSLADAIPFFVVAAVFILVVFPSMLITQKMVDTIYHQGFYSLAYAIGIIFGMTMPIVVLLLASLLIGDSRTVLFIFSIICCAGYVLLSYLIINASGIGKDAPEKSNGIWQKWSRHIFDLMHFDDIDITVDQRTIRVRAKTFLLSIRRAAVLYLPTGLIMVGASVLLAVEHAGSATWLLIAPLLIIVALPLVKKSDANSFSLDIGKLDFPQLAVLGAFILALLGGFMFLLGTEPQFSRGAYSIISTPPKTDACDDGQAGANDTWCVLSVFDGNTAVIRRAEQVEESDDVYEVDLSKPYRLVNLTNLEGETTLAEVNFAR